MNLNDRKNMRLPRPLLDAVKATAAKAEVAYQYQRNNGEGWIK
jgi:predicted DNA binding CopG/RHH family protein